MDCSDACELKLIKTQDSLHIHSVLFSKMGEKVQQQFAQVKKFNRSMSSALKLFRALKNGVINCRIRNDPWNSFQSIHLQNSKEISTNDLIIGKETTNQIKVLKTCESDSYLIKDVSSDFRLHVKIPEIFF